MCAYTLSDARGFGSNLMRVYPLEPPTESTSVRSRKAWQFESGGVRGRQLRTPRHLPPFVVLRAGKRRLDPVREAGSTYPNPTPTLPPKIQYSGLNLALKVQSSFLQRGVGIKRPRWRWSFFMNKQLQPNPPFQITHVNLITLFSLTQDHILHLLKAPLILNPSRISSPINDIRTEVC